MAGKYKTFTPEFREEVATKDHPRLRLVTRSPFIRSMACSSGSSVKCPTR